MRLLFFDNYKLGVLRDSAVIDVSGLVSDIPRAHPQDIIASVIERWSEFAPRFAEASDHASGVELASVRIRPPLPRPVNIDCMAVNYLEDGTLSERPPINGFQKSPSSIIGYGDVMELPDVPATIFEGEAELAVVIGRRRVECTGV